MCSGGKFAAIKQRIFQLVGQEIDLIVANIGSDAFVGGSSRLRSPLQNLQEPSLGGDQNASQLIRRVVEDGSVALRGQRGMESSEQP